ncbi:MAG TPA: hypothetical protein VMT54_19495 [Candidatus Cybelea sp.]|nr:hypothetical protein [Candidatus Cybelea sp.]
MFKFLAGPDRNRTEVKIDKDSVERLQVGAVLLESSAFLPKHRFPQWRVIKRFKDRNDTPHVVIQNLREPSSCKSLSLQGLITSRKYALATGFAH